MLHLTDSYIEYRTTMTSIKFCVVVGSHALASRVNKQVGMALALTVIELFWCLVVIILLKKVAQIYSSEKNGSMCFRTFDFSCSKITSKRLCSLLSI